MERVMAGLDDVRRRLQALRDESGGAAPAAQPPSPGRAEPDDDDLSLDDVGGDTPPVAPPARLAPSRGDDPFYVASPATHAPQRTDAHPVAPLATHEPSPRLDRNDETVGLLGNDEPIAPLDDESGFDEQDDEDESAPPAPRSPLLRYPSYADLVHLQDLLERKRESLRLLVRECRGLGLTYLARESGLSVKTIQRLAGPPNRPTPPPDLGRAALCVRELRAYRALLDRRSALLELMRRVARRARDEGAGLRRIERLFGVPDPTGTLARDLLATTHRRPWPDEVPDELREPRPAPAPLTPTGNDRPDEADYTEPERDEGGG